MMNAVGIDVSKRKSTVTILRPGDEVILDPVDIPHTRSAMDGLIGLIDSLDGDTKVCMECTGRYYEPVASRLSVPASSSALSILSSSACSGMNPCMR